MEEHVDLAVERKKELLAFALHRQQTLADHRRRVRWRHSGARYGRHHPTLCQLLRLSALNLALRKLPHGTRFGKRCGCKEMQD